MIKLALLSGIIALAVTSLATPLVRLFARKYGAMDWPNKRKVHEHPIPRWGGLAIAFGFFVGIAALFSFPQFRALLRFGYEMPTGPFAGANIKMVDQLVGLLVGAGIVLLLGAADDRNPQPAVTKLFVQILAASVVAFLGVFIWGLAFPGGRYVAFSKFVSLGMTIAWIIGFMNAVNLVDGLDGLATGIAAIAAASFLAVSFLQGEPTAVLAPPSLAQQHMEQAQAKTKAQTGKSVKTPPSSRHKRSSYQLRTEQRAKERAEKEQRTKAFAQKEYITKQQKLAMILAGALAGACAGFLFHNFHPAKIFMGDSGSYFIGFVLGAISIIGTLKTAAVMAVVVPVIVVALPVLDVGFAIVRRISRRRPVMEADREHMHHRLLAHGWSQREIVLLMFTITLVLSNLAIIAAAWRK